VYGEPLRIPDELLTQTAEPVDPAYLITELCQYMARLNPFPAPRHASLATFMHSDLQKGTHVFLRQATTCQALEPPLQRTLPGPVTERRRCNSSCVGALSPCQLTGSSRPSSSMGPTAGTTSSSQPQQLRPQYHLPGHHSPPPELHAPVITSISLLA
jgi:hypothetical protein